MIIYNISTSDLENPLNRLLTGYGSRVTDALETHPDLSTVDNLKKVR